jgi:hypothetical protein
MKTIRCKIAGRRTDTPVLTVDKREDLPIATYRSDISGDVARFDLADSEPGPYGATIAYGKKTTRYVLPADTGEFDGPTLEYPQAPSRLRVDGKVFRNEAGERKVIALHSDFRLLKMFLDGEDVSAILDARMAAVSDAPVLARGPRVFGTCSFLFPLDPTTYGDRYYEGLQKFSRLLFERNLYWEYVAFADAQLIPLDQHKHWRRACEALESEPNVIIELANEYAKNGVDPGQFEPMGTHPLSRGSGLGDDPPYGGHTGEKGPWHFGTFHPRRDWKWPFTVAATVNEIQKYPNLNVAILVDEPIGADEVDQPNRRSTDAELFEKMAVDCAIWAAGGTFHSTAGLSSLPWGEKQTRCAQAFFRGLAR